MRIEFILATDNYTGTPFSLLRVGMFKLYFNRWAERFNVHDYHIMAHEGNVRVQFKHSSDYSIFGLAWDGYDIYTHKVIS